MSMEDGETLLLKLEFDRVRQRILRYAASDPGRALIGALAPSTAVAEVRTSLACVTEMKMYLEEEEEFPLAGIHPVAPSVRKSAVEGAVLAPREIMQIGTTLHATRLAREALNRRRERFALLWEIASPLAPNKVLEYNIEQAIDESGAVRSTASKELQAIRRSIADTAEQLRKRLDSILRSVSDLGFSQDDIITTREGRMVIPVKSEHRNKVPGFIHSASSSGATVFVEPTETLELNNDIRSLHFREQREIERILRQLTEQVRDQREELLANVEILALLDSLHARARYSIEVIGIAPIIEDAGPLRLVGARHPVLLMIHGRQGTVPLDLDLGNGYSTLVISGPNAGGKSVAMKCVGLLAAMVQAGLHIPAAEGTRMRIFSSMFVDIGDEQSIENDLSTFSSHLRNLRSIATQANSRSLVLIDEIGSGTDPSEGGAIAAAVLAWLTAKGVMTIATTHHSALKVFAHDTDGVENGAMEFDLATLTPTYRFRSGIPGSSYALEMARRVNIPEDILATARGYLGGQQTRLESLIAELENSAQQARRAYEQARSEKAALDGMIEEYKARMANLSREIKELKRKAVEDAEEIVQKANATIERTVREIKESHAGTEIVRQARKEIATLRSSLEKEEQETAEKPPAQPAKLGAGSLVTLGESTDVGTVASVSADGEHAVVVFGAVKMRLRVRDLRVTTRRRRGHETPMQESEKPETVETDLDIRGMTGDEAIPLVDKFIDAALLAGLHRVDVIHGKGTGALRKRVGEFLSRHPRVKSHRFGEWNEGGDGATVVELSDNE